MAETSSHEQEQHGIRHVLRALSSRNYRLYFFGQSVSLLGTWLTRIATSWLVYRLTESPFLLGVVGFVGQIPTLLLAPFAGVLVDRWSRRRILIVTQVLAMMQSLVLAYLALSGQVAVWHVGVLSAVQGVINAFDTAARQAFLVELVEDRNTLPNAIALNSSMVTGARLLGPTVGGVLIAAVGEGMCFLIDGLSYIGVIASLVAIRVAAPARRGARGRFASEVAEGFRYAFGFPPIRALLLLLALVSLMGVPYTVLMPVIAKEVLHGGPYTLGLLMGASGVGSMIAAVYLAGRRSVVGLGRHVVVAAGLFGISLIALSLSRHAWLSMVILVVVGFSMMLQMASSNTILQTVAEEDKRGRLMSIYSMAFFGTVPIGSLMAGVLADWIGVMPTLAAGGVCCVAGALYYASRLERLREMVRPIYVRLGILPEVAAGLQAANAQANMENK